MDDTTAKKLIRRANTRIQAYPWNNMLGRWDIRCLLEHMAIELGRLELENLALHKAGCDAAEEASGRA